MNGRIPGSIALAAFVLVTGASGATASRALAQDTPAAAASAAPAAPATSAPAPADTAATPAPSAAPAASVAAPSSTATPKNTGPSVTGYAYHDHAAAPAVSAPRHHARLAHHANEVQALVTGFEMLADGGSRLFVQLSRQVDVDQGKESVGGGAPRHGKHGRAAKQAPNATLTRLTYVLKGTELARSNDANSLETMHFNTPVVRARLQPSGHDLRFVILLRADVTPAMKVVPTKDNGAMLQIDFPQGSYVTLGAGPASDSTTNEPVNGALPSQRAPGDANGSGDTNGSMGPQ
jgi:hypothetical protein